MLWRNSPAAAQPSGRRVRLRLRLRYCPEAGLGWAAFFNRPADAAYRFGRGLIEGAFAQRYGPRRARLPISRLAPIALTNAQQQSIIGNYIGRDFAASIKLENGVLKMRTDKTASTMEFVAPDEAFVPDDIGDGVLYRRFAARADEAAHLECWVGEKSLDYNDGPHDAVGPDKPGWNVFLGQYQIQQWGGPTDLVNIHRQNGWLWLNNVRLIAEPEPGLFFTSDGEAVDFREPVPTWRNIRLRRV